MNGTAVMKTDETEGLEPMSAQGRTMQTRASAEVQGAVFMAKQFPRDLRAVQTELVERCRSVRLAEEAEYEYPRGGSKVVGPSIRLAEAILQAWGNADCGWIEVERKRGASVVSTFAWDYQKNVRKTLTFSVPHKREAGGESYDVKSERDIYEVIANQAARRVRQCILALIPLDVVEDALEQCHKTIEIKNKGEPLVDRVTKLLAYLGELGVGDAAPKIEKKLGHNIAAITEGEYMRLRRLCQSIKDGMIGKDEALPSPSAVLEPPKQSAAERMKQELASDAPVTTVEREPGADDDKDDEKPAA